MPRKQRVVNPQAARSFVAHAGQNAPATYSAFEAYCQRTGQDSGTISRVRWSTLYSTVAVVYDAAGNATLGGTRLYAQPLGGTDANMGTLTDRETNLSAANKMPNGQAFEVASHGFDLYVHTPVVAATTILVQNTMIQLLNGITCSLLTGSETKQIWGPISAHMIGSAVNYTSAVAASEASPPTSSAARAGIPVEPRLVLEPGMSFSIEVALRALPAVIAGNAGLIVGLRHWFFGQTRTAVDG